MTLRKIARPQNKQRLFGYNVRYALFVLLTLTGLFASSLKPTRAAIALSTTLQQTEATPSLQNKQDPTWAEGQVQLLTITARNGGHSRPVRAVAFHPGNRFFATGSADKSIRLWDLQGQSRVKVFSLDSEVLSLAFSRDGRWLASSSLDGTVQLWDWQMGQLSHTLSGHSKMATAVAFTPDDQYLISGSGDHRLKVWDVSSAQEVSSIDTGQWIQSIALDPQNPEQVAIAGLGRQVDIWNWQTQRKEQSSERFSSPVYAVDWHPTRARLAFSPDSSINPETTAHRNTLALMDLRSERMSSPLTGHSDYVSFVEFSPSGDTLLSGSWDRTIRLWNAQTGELIRSFLENERRILSGDFSDNGRAFAVGSADGSIKIYQTQE
ncbi:MAG: WD40 repeat domain-containing protein [Cyanobacteria bacterium J06634_6]